MVPENDPSPPPKVSRHRRTAHGDTIFTSSRRVYAGLYRRTDGHLRVGCVNRTGEWLEVDGQGVTLIRHGKRHVLYLWGTVPGVYLPH